MEQTTLPLITEPHPGFGYMSAKPDRETADALYQRAAALGIEGIVAEEKLHVTLMYDISNIIRYQGCSNRPFTATVSGWKRMGEVGSKWESIALTLESPGMLEYHEWLKEAGLVHSYPDLQLHMSLKYRPLERDAKILSDSWQAFKLIGPLNFMESPWKPVKDD